MFSVIAAGLGSKISSPLTGSYQSVKSGLPKFISNIIILATTIGGILVLLNLITAGYDYLTAGGDPKKVTNAWSKIWQSLVGLIIIIAALAISSVIDSIFGTNILTPEITGPGSL